MRFDAKLCAADLSISDLAFSTDLPARRVIGPRYLNEPTIDFKTGDPRRGPSMFATDLCVLLFFSLSLAITTANSSCPSFFFYLL